MAVLKIEQNLFKNPLFYVFNFFIPLLIPSIIIIVIGPDKGINITEAGMIVSQILLYNIIMLSTNLGMLNTKSETTDDFKEKNNAFSIVFIILNAFLMAISFYNFKLYDPSTTSVFDYRVILLIVFAVVSSYFTVFFLSKNPNVSFGGTKLNELAQKRDAGSDNLENRMRGQTP